MKKIIVTIMAGMLWLLAQPANAALKVLACEPE